MNEDKRDTFQDQHITSSNVVVNPPTLDWGYRNAVTIDRTCARAEIWDYWGMYTCGNIWRGQAHVWESRRPDLKVYGNLRKN